MDLDPTSTLTLYLQVRDAIKRSIEEKKYTDGSKLPAEHALCNLFGVSRITVIKALNMLEDEGYIYRVQGKGSFVATKKIERNLNQVNSFTESIARQGFKLTTKVISKQFLKATPHLNHLFGREESCQEDFIQIRRIRYVDEVPVAVNHSIFSIDFGAKLTEEELAGSLYDLLRNRYQLELVRQDEVLSVALADDETAKMLQLPKGFPMFLSEGTTYTVEQPYPIEISKTYFRGDKIKCRTHVLNFVYNPEDSNNSLLPEV